MPSTQQHLCPLARVPSFCFPSICPTVLEADNCWIIGRWLTPGELWVFLLCKAHVFSLPSLGKLMSFAHLSPRWGQRQLRLLGTSLASLSSADAHLQAEDAFLLPHTLH